MRRAASICLLVMVLANVVMNIPDTAWASLSNAIENTIKTWFNSSGKLVRFRFAPSASKTVPVGYCDLYLDNGSMSLVGQCGGGSATVIIPLSALGCSQDGAGNLTCNSFSSVDQNSLTVPAANRWRLFDNDVNLTPDPTCANYGQSGIITILDKDESATDIYALCDGTTEVGSVSHGLQPFVTWEAPYGTAMTGGNTATFTADTCTCWEFNLTQPIADLDTISLVISTADAGADETLTLGIYSLDGATRYFNATVTDTGTGAVNVSNGTATPGAMRADTYWLCFGYNNAASKNIQLRPTNNDAYRVAQFTQACSSGTLPSTLTTPSVTAANALLPAFTMTDD